MKKEELKANGPAHKPVEAPVAPAKPEKTE